MHHLSIFRAPVPRKTAGELPRSGGEELGWARDIPRRAAGSRARSFSAPNTVIPRFPCQFSFLSRSARSQICNFKIKRVIFVIKVAVQSFFLKKKTFSYEIQTVLCPVYLEHNSTKESLSKSCTRWYRVFPSVLNSGKLFTVFSSTGSIQLNLRKVFAARRRRSSDLIPS